MRPVTRVQRDTKDIGRAAGQSTRRLGQPAPAHVAHDRPSGCEAEGTRHVKARHVARRRDVLQRNLFAEMRLDVPERFAHQVHTVSQAAGTDIPASRQLRLIDLAGGRT
jgi:hypothetical protein